MKIAILKVAIFFMRVLYAPMKLRKTQDKIVYLSRQSDNKTLDYKLLEESISKLSPETKQVFRTKFFRGDKSFAISYIPSIIGDMFAMSNARIVITDTYSIPVSCLSHRKELKVFQIWHALGATKKFGLQSVGKTQGRDEKIAKAMHMHENYDFVLAPSKVTGEIFKEAFGVKDSQIKIAPLPRVDNITNGILRKDEFFEINPDLKDKKLVLYLPTFREGDRELIEKLRNTFNGKKEKLLISAHHLTDIRKDTFEGDFSTYDLMKIADCVITDYSACAYEASLLNKPVFFFVPDIEEYEKEQGLNFNPLEGMRSCSFISETELYKAVINSDYDYEQLKDFRNKYVDYSGEVCSDRLAHIILDI